MVKYTSETNHGSRRELQMTARYAVYDTVTDRDVREFDDLPHAYAEIDRLRPRHGARYAVRTALEHRERVQTAQVVENLLCAQAAAGATDDAPLDAPDERGAAFEIPAAVQHLVTAMERLGKDVVAIKGALPKREAERSGAADAAMPSGVEIAPTQTPARPAGRIWDKLSHADVEHAKQQLATQRGAIVRRHAEELRDLISAQDEIDALDRLIDAFAVKFRYSAASPSEPPSESSVGEDGPRAAEENASPEARTAQSTRTAENFTGSILRQTVAPRVPAAKSAAG
jgi:hypothetical protein